MLTHRLTRESLPPIVVLVSSGRSTHGGTQYAIGHNVLTPLFDRDPQRKWGKWVSDTLTLFPISYLSLASLDLGRIYEKNPAEDGRTGKG
jgi:hypothetical protein